MARLNRKIENLGESPFVKSLSEWIHLLAANDPVPARILFRVDAGRIKGLSYGHLSRCLVLSRAFRKTYKSESLFLMRGYPEGVTHARNAGERVKPIPVGLGMAQETERVLKAMEQFSADVLVVDLPYRDIDTSYFTELKGNGKRVLFIDDSRYISPDADIVLNSSILAVQNTRKARGRNIRYFLGPEYFIFDPEKRVAPSRKKGKGFKVVISFGGSDPAGLTRETVRYLAEERLPGISFQVILGPGFKEKKLIRDTVKHSANNMLLIDNPPHIYSFFVDADLVVCAGGRTLYELMALDVRALAIASIEQERPVVAAFLEKNLIVAGLSQWDEQEFDKKLFHAVQFLDNQRNGK